MRRFSTNVRNAMRKLAFVPLAPAAQDAMAQQGGMPPMDPSMQEGMPMPPGGDPSMMGGMPPQGGAPAPIQTVPGPNGEPIDPETGFIVLDPQQGIEQDPMTGILFSKFTGEFATPDGQPMDPQQAQQMIMQAMQQGGGMPPQGDPSMAGGMPPMDPAMGGMPPADPSMGGMPADPSMMPPMDPSMQEGMPMPPGGEAGGMPPEDPSMGEAPQPTIDEQTGLPIDPETGYYMSQGAPTGEPGAEEEMIPGLEQFIAKAEKVNDRQDKAIKRMTSEMVGTRTDIQALRREIQQINDNQDTALARMENILAMLESIISGGREPMAQPLQGE